MLDLHSWVNIGCSSIVFCYWSNNCIIIWNCRRRVLDVSRSRFWISCTLDTVLTCMDIVYFGHGFALKKKAQFVEDYHRFDPLFSTLCRCYITFFKFFLVLNYCLPYLCGVQRHNGFSLLKY